jgi:hypothetical protein
MVELEWASDFEANLPCSSNRVYVQLRAIS